MQTFVTHFSNAETAHVLDDRRLGKQRVEALQILQSLKRKSGAWYSHPAVQMWKGYERGLAYYGMTMCDEWRNKRKFNDTTWDKFFDSLDGNFAAPAQPVWRRDIRLLTSHRSNLVRKDPDFYGPRFPETPENMPYLWAVIDENRQGYHLRVSWADLSRVESGERVLPDDLRVLTNGTVVNQ